MGFFLVLIVLLPIFEKVSSNSFVSAATTNQAKIMIEAYDIIKGKVVEGGKIELELTFKNIDSKLTAENITVDLEAVDDMMYPIYGESNQIFIEKIQPKGTHKVKVKLDIAPSLKERTAVRLNFLISYFDKINGESRNETFILLPTVQECVMNVKNLSVANTATLGAKSLISVACVNAGITEIYEAFMYIEGDILAEQKKVLIGNIPVGEQMNFDTSVNFQKAGEQTIKIQFEYKDSEGHKFKTSEAEYIIHVTENEVATKEPLDADSKEPSQVDNSILWKVSLAGGLLVGVILVIVIIKKRR